MNFIKNVCWGCLLIIMNIIMWEIRLIKDHLQRAWGEHCIIIILHRTVCHWVANALRTCTSPVFLYPLTAPEQCTWCGGVDVVWTEASCRETHTLSWAHVLDSCQGQGQKLWQAADHLPRGKNLASLYFISAANCKQATCTLFNLPYNSTYGISVMVYMLLVDEV